MFDLRKLQRGDLLFTRSKIIGTGISRITGGRFGHVMLYLDNMIIHADTKGVWSKNPQRIIVNDKSRLAAFRLKSLLSTAEFKQIDSYARTRIGTLYSTPEAANSLPLLQKKASERIILDRQFCSRLVAQTFSQIGISLVVDPNFCTPNEIATSDLLGEIFDVTRQAEISDIDLNKTPDYNYQIQVETFRWLNKIRKLAEKHQVRQIHSQSDVGQWIFDHPQFDKEICTYINETKYLSLYDSDRRRLPWRYNPKWMLEALLLTPSPKESLEFERHQNASMYARIYEERQKAIHNAQSGLAYFKLEEWLQTRRFIEMIMWKEAVDYAHAAIAGGNPEN